MHDSRAGIDGLLVVQVDALADELRLAGQVRVIGSRRGACGDKRQPVLGRRGPTVVTTTWARAAIALSVDGCEASAVISGQDCAGFPQGFPDRQQLVLGTTRECDARVAARLRPGIRRSAFRRTRSRRTGRCRIHAGSWLGSHSLRSSLVPRCDPHSRSPSAVMIRRYPSVSGSSMSSPSTCWARNAMTTWYQILACCGESTQWFSDGK